MKIRALLVGLVAMGLSAAAVAADPIVIKFSHVVAQDTPKGKAAEKFKALAEQYTNGAVKVEVYANSTLYKDKEEMEALQLGAVQLLAPSLAKFGPLGVREFEVFDLPYIFDGYDALNKITQGAVGQQLLAKLEPKGIRGLAFWDNGFKSFSANTPIKKPEDLRGKKMRIQSSKVLEEQMREVKSLPQVMAFSEVYQALQTGVVDGTENPHSNLFTQKMHEVQKHMTVTDHGYLGYAVIANKIAQEENDKSLEAIKKSGKTQVYMPTKEEKLAFKKVLVPVHQKMESRIGKEIIQNVYKETGFDPNSL